MLLVFMGTTLPLATVTFVDRIPKGVSVCRTFSSSINIYKGGEDNRKVKSPININAKKIDIYIYIYINQGTHLTCIFKFPVFSLSDCKFSLCQFT